ncbi:MAG: IS630 family transposase [Planctomycetota bacterium]
MPFESKRAALVLDEETRMTLEQISRARTEPNHRVERARMMLSYAAGESVSAVARALSTNRPRVERCLSKALEMGAMAALKDLPGRGHPPVITDDARAWVISLACQKPKDLGYSYELWTTDLLAKHIRKHCRQQGHPSLKKLGRGTVSKLLSQAEIRPHKIQYYLERRDAEFERKMAEVLCVYRDVELLREAGTDDMIAVLSYDEKPGIQAIGLTAPDLAPVEGKHSCWGRDHEYVRHGTVTLMAAIDLLTGHVHGHVVDRHRSLEFVTFLKSLDQHYPTEVKIRVVLDNHSAHISKETRTYLATVPNRFEFVFTPKHGSWLNLIESFFAKMAKSFLRGIRVPSKAELKARILLYLKEINKAPVVFRWKYKLDTVPLT